MGLAGRKQTRDHRGGGVKNSPLETLDYVLCREIWETIDRISGGHRSDPLFPLILGKRRGFRRPLKKSLKILGGADPDHSRPPGAHGGAALGAARLARTTLGAAMRGAEVRIQDPGPSALPSLPDVRARLPRRGQATIWWALHGIWGQNGRQRSKRLMLRRAGKGREKCGMQIINLLASRNSLWRGSYTFWSKINSHSFYRDCLLDGVLRSSVDSYLCQPVGCRFLISRC